MKQEDKDLLLKDLCARLPYFTKVQIKNEIVVLDSICDDDGYHFNFIGDNREGVNIEEIKPYLFPLSNVVEEIVTTSNKHIAVNVDFFHEYHIDYRGLIPKGLAIDATGLNIY